MLGLPLHPVGPFLAPVIPVQKCLDESGIGAHRLLDAEVPPGWKGKGGLQNGAPIRSGTAAVAEDVTEVAPCATSDPAAALESASVTTAFPFVSTSNDPEHGVAGYSPVLYPTAFFR